MSDDHDNDELDPLDQESDEQIRARMRALDDEIAQRTDADAALERLSRRSGPSAARFLAIAACVIAALALAVALVPGPETVDTTDQPRTTDCPGTEGALAPTPTPGGQMKMRFAIPVASAATAILLASACSDDGPTTLARGEDIDPVGHDNLGGQTLSINAVEEDGEVTGEFRLNEVVITLQCADTDTDGLVILGGEITTPDSDAPDEVGNLLALIIREGDPDSVALFPDVNDAGSCTELLEAIPEDGPDADLGFVELNPGEDIETG